MAAQTRRTHAGYLAAALGVLLVAAASAQPVREPAPGVLLVADERMADPRFSRSVVLLIAHDSTGSWGLIINKRTDVRVGKVLPDIEPPVPEPRVHFGGPVRINRLRLLYRDEAASDEAATGLPGVHWSDSREELKTRLEQEPGALRIYAGYSGWAPGQLSLELAHGGWRMIEGRPGHVFDDNPEKLWQRLSEALDGIAL